MRSAVSRSTSSKPSPRSGAGVGRTTLSSRAIRFSFVSSPRRMAQRCPTGCRTGSGRSPLCRWAKGPCFTRIGRDASCPRASLHRGSTCSHSRSHRARLTRRSAPRTPPRGHRGQGSDDQDTDHARRDASHPWRCGRGRRWSFRLGRPRSARRFRREGVPAPARRPPARCRPARCSGPARTPAAAVARPSALSPSTVGGRLEQHRLHLGALMGLESARCLPSP